MSSQTVDCTVLKCKAEALEQSPYPGELGQKITANVSAEGWQLWLQRLVLIINENGLNTAVKNDRKLIEKHMLGFLFDEGEYGQLPQGYQGTDTENIKR